jgi:hypothetical protein
MPISPSIVDFLCSLDDEQYELTLQWLNRNAIESARQRGRLTREFIRAVEAPGPSRSAEAAR